MNQSWDEEDGHDYHQQHDHSNGLTDTDTDTEYGYDKDKDYGSDQQDESESCSGSSSWNEEEDEQEQLSDSSDCVSYLLFCGVLLFLFSVSLLVSVSLLFSPLTLFPSPSSLSSTSNSVVSLSSSARFWWLDVSLNQWASARYQHQLRNLSSPPPPSSAWYTQLLYDSFLLLPNLPATSMANRRFMTASSFRHVRIVGERLKIHLPQFVGDVDTYTAHDASVYAYQPNSVAAGLAFEDRPFDGWYPGQADIYKGLKAWDDSTLWPIPSSIHEAHAAPSDASAATSSESSAANVFSWSSVWSTCHATQLDHLAHSHGRLHYYDNPITMMKYNRESIHRLHNQLPKNALGSFIGLTIWRFNGNDAGLLPVDLEYGPIDYEDQEQCAVVLDHAYIAESLGTWNPWHAYGDWGMPLHNFLHDPCFFPLNMNVTTGKPTHKQETSATSYPSTSDCSTSSFPGPTSCASNAHYLVYNDTRLIIGQHGGGQWDTGFELFLSPYQAADVVVKPDRTIPHVVQTQDLQKAGSICIKDAHIGIPWYMQTDMYTTEQVDPQRKQWEKHVHTHHLRLMEERLQSQLAGAALTRRRHQRIIDTGDPYIDKDIYNQLEQEFLAALNRLNITDHVHGETPIRLTEWLQVLPPPWYAPSSYEVRMQERLERKQKINPNYTHAPTVMGMAGIARPFSVNEVNNLNAMITANRLSRLSSLSASSTARLRMLFVVRRGTGRVFEHENLVIDEATAAGFAVTVHDFPRVRSASEWLNLFNFIRTFDVLVAVHGAALVNLQYMLPSSAVLIEFFPECWCWSNPCRWMYSTKLAEQTQVRSLNFGVPCPVGDVLKPYYDQEIQCVNQQPKADDFTLKIGMFTPRPSYATPEEVKQTMKYIFQYVHDSFLTIPKLTARYINVPLIRIR